MAELRVTKIDDKLYARIKSEAALLRVPIPELVKVILADAYAKPKAPKRKQP